MLTALLTSAVSAVVENVRATIIREKQSRMAQQYTLPSRAGCSVMSVHHNSLGLVAANRRFTRSSGVLTLIRFGMPRPGGADAYNFRGGFPTTAWRCPCFTAYS